MTNLVAKNWANILIFLEKKIKNRNRSAITLREQCTREITDLAIIYKAKYYFNASLSNNGLSWIVSF